MLPALSRRTLLAVTALVPAAALVGCAGQTPASVQALVVQYGAVVAAKLSSIIAVLPAGTLSPSVLATINQALSLVTSTVTALSSATGGQTWINEAETVVKAVAGVVIPPPWNLAVPLVAALITAIAGMIGGAAPVSAAIASRHLMAARMTPDQIVAELEKIHN